MAIDQIFTGIAAADYPAALDWYGRLFGRPPDVVVTDGESMWQVVDSGWIYLVADAGRAGNASLTLFVDDLERELAGLRERGLVPGAIEAVGTTVRKAVTSDPEGNRITLGEDLGVRER